MVMQTNHVVIGLGSNQNAIENLRRALLDLRREPDFKVIQVSRIYESMAQLPADAPLAWDQAYLNAAVLIEVKNFDPQNLLVNLKKMEIKLGRVSSEKWAPRVIDLDILYVENLKFQSENLQIPHPLLFDRPFAFLPAHEVCKTVPLPEKKITFETRISEKHFWPHFVGILNVTPDSFSDGGRYTHRENFLKQARKLIHDGADYLDIGAESTRPQAKPVSIDEEVARLTRALSAIEELKQEGLSFKVSIDSRNHQTLRQIVSKYQIDLLNDVAGLSDGNMLELVKEYGLSAVCMHSLSVPADRDIVLSSIANPVVEITNWWIQKEKTFNDYQIQPEKIYFDPGFGFGKTVEQNFYLMDHLDQFSTIRNPFFLGYSRKSFLQSAEDRDVATSRMTAQINPAFCQFLRVHDISIQKKALSRPHEL